MMKREQAGFTLIELVMVIVILGILAATALPKFIDLSNEANEAALQGIKGQIDSAAAINYAARKVASAGVPIASGNDCNTKVGNLLEGGIPDGYSVSGNVPNCMLVQTSTNASTSIRIMITD